METPPSRNRAIVAASVGFAAIAGVVFWAVNPWPPPPPPPVYPSLADLLAPGGCTVDDAADEFTKSARDIVGQLLAGNATSPFPATIDSPAPAADASGLTYTGLVRRAVLVALPLGGKGRFRATVMADPPGGKDRDYELAILADPEPPPKDGRAPSVSPDARLRDDATRDQLLAILATPGGLGSVVLLAGPPSARRPASRLIDLIGIDFEPFEVTLNQQAGAEPAPVRLSIQSPTCEVRFGRDGEKYVLRRIAPVAKGLR